MSINPLFSFSVWLAFFLYFVFADQTFNWTFINLPSNGFLSECSTAEISVSTNPNNPPVPPYFLLAYEEFGATTMKDLGSNVASLTWTVDHAAGSNLLVTVVDSKGNSGGVSPQPLFVLSNSNTSCHSFVPSAITVTTNLTKAVETCDPVQFAIQGGQKPYTGSIVIAGSPSVINFTMGSNTDTLVWYNRAPPPDNFLFSVVDAKGQYAFSTGFGISSGSADLDCDSLPAALEFSSSGGSTITIDGFTSTPTESSTTIASPSSTSGSPSPSTSNPPTGALASTKKKPKAGAIAGGVVGGVVVLVLILLAYCFYLKKQREQVVRLNPRSVDLAGGETAQIGSGVTPFIIPSASANNRTRTDPTTGDSLRPPISSVSGSSSSASTAPLLASMKAVSVNDQSQTQSSTQGFVANTPSSETSQPPAQGPQSSQPIIRQHVDIADASPEVLELPPVYSSRPPLSRALPEVPRSRPAISNK